MSSRALRDQMVARGYVAENHGAAKAQHSFRDDPIGRAVPELVVATQDWHPESTPHFAKDGGIWPVHCVADSWGAAFHPALQVLGPSVKKGSNGEDGYSGFTMRDAETGRETPTELEDLVRGSNARRVVVCGLATDYCVRTTALDAVRLGFETFVLTDAIAAVNLEPDDGERALAEMADDGVRLEQSGA